MLPVLLDSAVRSLLLGVVVWVLLKAARLRDTRSETVIWTAVLIAALSMPILSRHVPGLVLTLPHLPAAAPAASSGLEVLNTPPDGGISTRPLPAWLIQHGRTCLMAVYLLGFSFCAIRLAVGLLLTVRLYRRAAPVQAAWVEARNIRATAAIRSPVSLAGTILLPVDYDEWSAAKRSAVLAHEEAHIARGDFFVQMAARIHCALFWFSPFAWWLQTKLAEIAETASDEAAIQRLNDRATYAEILVEVSRCAQKTPLIVAMAKSSFIQQRVEHILSEAPTRNLGLAQRMLSVALFAALAVAVAGAKTAVDPGAVAPPALPAAGANPAAPPSRKHGADSAPARVVRAAHVVRKLRGASSTAQDSEPRTYNPRALLDPVYATQPGYVPASTIVHAGREFYIRSTEKPVADVSVTYALERKTH
jgi:beta-lactamase regulating signal transducer with metallopeptidase domain